MTVRWIRKSIQKLIFWVKNLDFSHVFIDQLFLLFFSYLPMASILSLTDGVCLATGDTSSSSVELSFFSILCKFMSSSSTTLEKKPVDLVYKIFR